MSQTYLTSQDLPEHIKYDTRSIRRWDYESVEPRYPTNTY